MELTAEQINDFIGKAVLESQIGKAVQESVTKVVASLSKSYDNPFDRVIGNQVAVLIEEQVRTTYRPILEERIKASMQQLMTDEIVEKLIEAAFKKLTSSY